MGEWTRGEVQARMAAINRGEMIHPGRPQERCPRCAGPWMKEYLTGLDEATIKYAYVWHCIHCGEVSYGG